MRARFVITKLDRLRNRLQVLGTEAEEQMLQGLTKAAMLVDGTAKKSIQKPSKGKRYGKHVASKPGEAPNTDTGALVQSIAFKVHKVSLSAEVGTALAHGAHMEFGTRHVAARPWLKPAMDSNRSKIKKLLTLKFKKRRGGT